MIRGSRTENPSGSGQAGIGIQDCTLPDLGSRLVSVLESVTLAALAGAGTTGILTGVTGLSSTTTTLTYPTVESSPIAITSIGDTRTSITPADFMAGLRVELPGSMSPDRSMGPQVRNMGLHRRTASWAVTLALSAALTMAEPPENFPLAGDRVSVEDSTAVLA